MTRGRGIFVSVAACALALLGSACGAANSLEGSISESFSLLFDEVLIRKQDTALIVEYRKTSGSSPAKICKLVVETDGLDLKKGAKLKDEAFVAAVAVQREAQTGFDFPPVVGGDLELDRFQFRDGGHVSGEFFAQFDNGRNIKGRFDGNMTEISTD